MPVLSGIEAAKRMIKMKDNYLMDKNTKIVLMTGDEEQLS